MRRNEATQREVIERLSIVLHPAQAIMPAARGLSGSAERWSGDAPGPPLRRDVRVTAMQQRYRLYRVCGYGILSAWYHAAK
jgi:hypothetical protein